MSGVIAEALGSKSGLQTCLLHLGGETFKSQFDPSHLPPGDRCTNSEQILDRFKEIVYKKKKSSLEIASLGKIHGTLSSATTVLSAERV